jgi:hypothetical protein
MNIKESLKNIFIYNDTYGEVSIYKDLSIKERDRLKHSFNLHQNITLLIALMTMFCLTTYIYYNYLTQPIQQSSIIISIVLSTILLLLHNSMKKKYSFSGNVVIVTAFILIPLPCISMFLIYISSINISRRITMITKNKNNITIKINMNLQEYSYKDNKLHSIGEKPAIRRLLSCYEDSSPYMPMEGDSFYHNGFKWGFKMKGYCIDVEDFIIFKESIDMKEKLKGF